MLVFKEIFGNIICYDDFNFENNSELKDFIIYLKYEKLIKKFDEKIILVLGGDGTFLGSFHKFKNRKMPFLGINFGNVGFLLNSKNVLENLNLENGPKLFKKISHKLLSYEIISSGKKIYGNLINELNINSNTGKSITLGINSNYGHLEISGDGILASTPMGSTGYNFSLGGNILNRNFEGFLLTPKASFSHRNITNIIFSEKDEILIENSGRKLETIFFADGIEIFKSSNLQDFQVKISYGKENFEVFIADEKNWINKNYNFLGFENLEN